MWRINVKNIEDQPKVIGTKQTLKAIGEGKANTIVLAEDTDDVLKEKIISAAQAAQIPIVMYPDKKQLGLVCHIECQAAVIAILD